MNSNIQNMARDEWGEETEFENAKLFQSYFSDNYNKFFTILNAFSFIL